MYPTFEDVKEGMASQLGSDRIRNLTPHAIRVLVYPYCWLGQIPDKDALEQAGWKIQEVNSGKKPVCAYLEIPADGEALRMDEETVPSEPVTVGLDGCVFMIEGPTGMMAGCTEKSYQPPVLPDPKPGTTLIVSLPLLMGLVMAGVHRADLVCPDTGPTAERDGSGQITGVRGFVRLGKPQSAC